MWKQYRFSLQPRRRGFHLITDEVLAQVADLPQFQIGWLHLFIQHTSASLTLNENADPDVPRDLETFFNRIAPESGVPVLHDSEGPDDMPAHVKATTIGSSLLIPISQGKLALGIWQGIYLCEHRNRAGARRLIATLFGETEETT